MSNTISLLAQVQRIERDLAAIPAVHAATSQRMVDLTLNRSHTAGFLLSLLVHVSHLRELRFFKSLLKAQPYTMARAEVHGECFMTFNVPSDLCRNAPAALVIGHVVRERMRAFRCKNGSSRLWTTSCNAYLAGEFTVASNIALVK